MRSISSATRFSTSSRSTCCSPWTPGFGSGSIGRSEPGGPPAMTRRTELALLGAILLVALVLRFAGLGRESLWLDEGYALRVAAGTPAAVVANAARETHPPLYYLLLHGWIGLTRAVRPLPGSPGRE